MRLPMTFREVRRDLFILAAVAVVIAAILLPSSRPVGAQALDQGVMFTCSADNIGATLTLMTGCAAPPPGTKFYITDIIAQSTTSTGGQFILQYGTAVRDGGTANCGTGTTSFLPSAASVARLSAAANTGAPTVIDFSAGMPLPSGKDLCVLGVGTNTTTIQITGRILSGN